MSRSGCVPVVSHGVRVFVVEHDGHEGQLREEPVHGARHA